MSVATRRWGCFAIAAGFYRFRPTSWRGPVLLIVSILDVLVYAAALYVVMTTVFEFSGVDRFMTMLVGLVPLRWSIGCALQASRVAHFVKTCRPVCARPFLATVVLAMGPSTVVFAISAALLVIGLTFMQAAPAGLGHMTGWGGAVIIVHLSWNVLLVFAIIYMRMRHVLLTEGAIIFAFVLLFILSPITYQFSDIPAAAGQILTSMNPASHLIAAYQNALWYGQDVSLQVLPLSAVFCVGILLLLSRLVRTRSANEPQDLDRPAHRLVWNGRFWRYSDTPAEPDCAANVFTRWSGELPWITGRSMLYLLGSTSRHVAASVKVFSALAPGSDSEQLLDTTLPIYTERVRNRLCIVMALLMPSGPVILDRLLDNEDAHSVEHFCAFVASSPLGLEDMVVLSARNEIAHMLAAYSPSDDDSIGL